MHHSFSPRLPVVVLLTALFSGGLHAQTTDEQPPPVLELAVAFEESAVVASGLPAAGEALFYSWAREPRGYFWRVRPYRTQATADAEGMARFELPDGTPYNSVWLVIEPASGAYVVATPEESQASEILTPGNALSQGAAGKWSRLLTEWEWSEFFYVRPSVGAWTLSLVDGAPNDEDGVDDGRTSVSFEQVEPYWGSPDPPTEFASGDVAFGVNPDTLQFFVVQLVSSSK